MPDLPEKYLNALPLYDDCCTDGTASSTETDFTIKALIPCKLNVVPTHTFKDGTCKYLVFGQFEQSLSKEQPTYAFIRAANSGEVVAKAEFVNEGESITISLVVNGDVSVKFDGENYFGASDFSDELTELFKQGKAYDDDRVEIYLNNWFEYFWEDDCEVEDADLCKASPEDILSTMEFLVTS